MEYALAAGVRVVQHRDKEADLAAMIAEARRLRRLCQKALFLVNDRVEVALAVGADGVHLGQEDLHYREARRLLGEKKIIGITVNTPEQALEAERLGADYLGVSPIFATRTKPDAGEPAGLHLLREIRRRVSLPLIAIGGITLDNVAYAPYSNFPVGAAVLTADGRIFTGCNIENASFGATICAERVAIFTAVAAGQRQIKALAVIAEHAATGGPLRPLPPGALGIQPRLPDHHGQSEGRISGLNSGTSPPPCLHLPTALKSVRHSCLPKPFHCHERRPANFVTCSPTVLSF